VGTPTATELEPLDWSVILLHEHFHQYQYALPNYYEQVLELDLHNGDKGGNWMLSYPFPYEDPGVNNSFGELTHALAAVLDVDKGSAERTLRMDQYRTAEKAFRDSVGESNWRYFQFQLWQEGVARWTEIAIVEAATHVRPELAEFASRKRESIRLSLSAIQREGLRTWKRKAFYSVGAVLAMLLNDASESWRARYLEHLFTLDLGTP